VLDADSLAEARAVTAALNLRIAAGEDRMLERKAQRALNANPTVTDLAAADLAHVSIHKRSRRDDEEIWRLRVEPKICHIP
jgi:hypothetical protein